MTPAFHWPTFAKTYRDTPRGRELPNSTMDRVSAAVIEMMEPGRRYTLHALSVLADAPAKPLSMSLRRASHRGLLEMSTRLVAGQFRVSYVRPDSPVLPAAPRSTPSSVEGAGDTTWMWRAAKEDTHHDS